MLLILTITIQNSYAIDENNSEYLTMEGYFNILVIDYQDGTSSEEYYLFVDTSKKGQIPYKMEFESPPASLFDLSGQNVKVKGYMKPQKLQSSSPVASPETMIVESITLSEQSQEVQSQTAEIQQAPRPIPSQLTSIAILLQYPNRQDIIHDKIYFENRFFDPDDSLAAYWNAHSYSALTLDGAVVDWQQLPKSRSEYASFGEIGTFAFNVLPDVLNLADQSIDFDGPDNIIQNLSPSNWRLSGGSDDVDELLLIFNGNVACFCAFAFLAPIQISTDEGQLYVGLSFYPDDESGFAFGTNLRDLLRGYGVAVHEMGHTFGWLHTNSGRWSIMDPTVSSTETDV